MRNHIVAAAVGVFAALGSVEASAESPAAADFQRLCVDTRGDSTMAFVIADVSGWTSDSIDAATFTQLTGNAEGREINRGTTSFRAFSAGQTVSGGVPRRRCALVSQGSFEAVADELTRLMPVDVGPRTDRQLTWNYISLDGRLQSLDHMSVQDAARAGQSGNPQVHVIALRIQGGAILLYTESDFGAVGAD